MRAVLPHRVLSPAATPGLICAMLASAAYFQAQGWTSLASERWLATSSPRSAHPPAPPPRSPARSESAILAEAFSSRAPSSEEGVPSARGACDELVTRGARLAGVIASDDASWSFAVVADGGGTRLVRVGQRLSPDGPVVSHIGTTEDPGSASSTPTSVWVDADVDGRVTRCELRLGRAVAVDPERRGAAEASGVRQVGPHAFVLDRAFVKALVGGVGLESDAGIAPAPDGRGLLLKRAAPSALATRIGLRAGDRVVRVNDLDLSDPDALTQAYARLETTDRFTVHVEREGAPLTIELTLDEPTSR